MDKRRILILGQSKEGSYEIRKLLDNQRFDLEIALDKEIGKQVLSARRMNLLVMHTEMIGEESADFFEFLEDEGISIPVLLLGEEAARLRDQVVGQECVQSFEKPYPQEQVLECIRKL